MLQNHSPLIQNGDFVLDQYGQLLMDRDILTQLPVSLSLYDAMYQTLTNSELIPYINNVSPLNVQRNTLINIIKNALQPLVFEGLLTDFSIQNPGLEILNGIEQISITIKVLDGANTPIIFTWSNFE